LFYIFVIAEQIQVLPLNTREKKVIADGNQVLSYSPKPLTLTLYFHH